LNISLFYIIFGVIVVIVVAKVLFGMSSFTNKRDRIITSYENGELDLTMNEISSLEQKHKKDPLIMWIMANIYFKQQQYILSMVTLQNIIDADSFNQDVGEVELREMLATIYEETGNIKKAMAEHEIIIALTDQDFNYLYKAGRVCYNHQEWSQAQKYFSLGMQQNDSNPDIAYLISDCYYRMHSYVAASQNIQKAIFLDGNNYLYYLLYGKILFAEKDYKDATNKFEFALNNCTDNDDVIHIKLFLANAFYELRDYGDSKRYYENVLEDPEKNSDENIIDERYKYADTLLKEKQIEKAVIQWKLIKGIRNIYLDIDAKLKTYSKIISNPSFRLAIETDIVEYLETTMYKILMLNGYVVTDYTRKSDTLAFFITIKKFGSEGQSYKNTFILDTSGHPVRQSIIDDFLEYIKKNKSTHSYVMSIGGFDNRLDVDDRITLVEPERFEAIMEGVISFSN